MAIDRTLFDLWVNDDGSNTVGTFINKVRIADDILDPIDDALAAAGVGGSTTQVLFNDAGVVAGDAGLTYNKTTDALTAGSLIPTLGQIVFPATQNASSNVNTFDDYEEGTWTPVLGGAGGTSGQTYTSQSGSYTKIGKLVLADFTVFLSAKGTITGAVEIQGLPFTVGSGSACMPITWSQLATSWVSVIGLLSGTIAEIRGATAAATGNQTALTTTDIGNTSILRGTFVYIASA